MIARAIAIGVGSTTPTLGDQKMELEVLRIPVNLIAYDPVLDKIIFKGEIPNSYIGKVTEVGIYSLERDAMNDSPSLTISEFTQNQESWSAGTWSTANTRLGSDSLRLSPTASSTVVAAKGAQLDLSVFSPVDAVSLGVFNLNGNAASVRVRFLQDTGNHFTRTFASPATGYSVLSGAKSSFVAVGTPSWAGITQVQVEVTASAAGVAQVDFDALTFVDMDFANTDMVLVAREVLNTPFTKAANSVNEIEFSLGVTL